MASSNVFSWWASPFGAIIFERGISDCGIGAKKKGWVGSIVGKGGKE